MYICIYVCMYVYMYACMCACMCICLHACMYVCACIHACMHGFVHEDLPWRRQKESDCAGWIDCIVTDIPYGLKAASKTGISVAPSACSVGE